MQGQHAKTKNQPTAWVLAAALLLVVWTAWPGQATNAFSQARVPDAPSPLPTDPTPLFTITGDANGPLVRPLAVTEGPNRSIYIADAGAGLVRAFDSAGVPMRSFGSDQGSGKLGFPAGLAFDDAGLLYVADTARKEVVIFTAQGRAVGTLGQNLGRPNGLFFRNGKFYVSDLDGRRVLVLDRDGQVLRQVGRGAGIGPGQFSYPTFVWVDENERIFVSDSNNNRVEVFDAGGNVLKILGATGAGGPLDLPRGLAVDAYGRLHVAQPVANRIAVFDAATGKALYSYSSSGGDKLEVQEAFPNGLSISDHRIYLTETGNKLVQVLAY